MVQTVLYILYFLTEQSHTSITGKAKKVSKINIKIET